ncbi:MAG: ribosome maturation factor RimM [Treponema sp.]|jgi:16S rRNA processing protein RimM|nr:ribosome maturation factor RimM [Treponema sp.]
MTNEFVIGLVGAPFGVEGRVKLRSLSGEFGHLLALDSARLRLGGKIAEYRIDSVSASPPSVKFAGVDSPEAARALKGAEILADRDHAAPLDTDEFYIEDLKGLDVVISRGGGTSERVGVISDVIEGGGGFLAGVALASGAQRLVPFRREFFGAIDLDAGRAELLVRWILEPDEAANGPEGPAP